MGDELTLTGRLLLMSIVSIESSACIRELCMLEDLRRAVSFVSPLDLLSSVFDGSGDFSFFFIFLNLSNKPFFDGDDALLGASVPSRASIIFETRDTLCHLGRFDLLSVLFFQNLV